jgi:hypothetical protein
MSHDFAKHGQGLPRFFHRVYLLIAAKQADALYA